MLIVKYEKGVLTVDKITISLNSKEIDFVEIYLRGIQARAIQRGAKKNVKQ